MTRTPNLLILVIVAGFTRGRVCGGNKNDKAQSFTRLAGFFCIAGAARLRFIESRDWTTHVGNEWRLLDRLRAPLLFATQQR